MELKVKFSNWSAQSNVSMLNKETAATLGINLEENIFISTLSSKGKRILSSLHVIDGNLVKKDEIFVSSEVKKKLRLRAGEKVNVAIAPENKSLTYIKKKLENKTLSAKEIDLIVKEIVENNTSDVETALFVAGVSVNGMNLKEVTSLTSSMIKYGNKMNIKSDLVVDKHSIGGIPGNRTSPIVVSICAAAGLIFPKTSSRAITSEAGTSDVIEAVADVEFSLSELKKILKKVGAFLVWGGSFGIAPADAEIIKVEKTLKIDSKSQLLASIMAKKLAIDSDYILIDIPFGKGAKVSRKEAESLKDSFLKIGKFFRKKIEVVITDGSQPIGNGIGPMLELIDIINILDPNKEGPKDLEKKSVFLASRILEMSGKAKKSKGIDLANEILSSGKALKKFKDIISAQNGDLKKIKYAKFKHNIYSKKRGTIKSINNKNIISLARILGCPGDKSSGMYLHHHVGQKIRKNDLILTFYSDSKEGLKEGLKFYNSEETIAINH